VRDLEREEAKIKAEIKKLAKVGEMGTAKVRCV